MVSQLTLSRTARPAFCSEYQPPAARNAHATVPGIAPSRLAVRCPLSDIRRLLERCWPERSDSYWHDRTVCATTYHLESLKRAESSATCQHKPAGSYVSPRGS